MHIAANHTSAVADRIGYTIAFLLSYPDTVIVRTGLFHRAANRANIAVEGTVFTIHPRTHMSLGRNIFTLHVLAGKASSLFFALLLAIGIPYDAPISESMRLRILVAVTVFALAGMEMLLLRGAPLVAVIMAQGSQHNNGGIVAAAAILVCLVAACRTGGRFGRMLRQIMTQRIRAFFLPILTFTANAISQTLSEAIRCQLSNPFTVSMILSCQHMITTFPGTALRMGGVIFRRIRKLVTKLSLDFFFFQYHLADSTLHPGFVAVFFTGGRFAVHDLVIMPMDHTIFQI